MESQSLAEVINNIEMGGFQELARLDNRLVGVFRTPAESWVWERHPPGDEMLHVLEGELEMTLLLDDGLEKTLLGPGQVFVVPRGVWHRPYAISNVSVFFVTPAQTETSSAEDPRTDPHIQTEAL